MLPRVASFQTLQATHGLDSPLRGNDEVGRFCDNHAMLLDFFYHLRNRGLKPSTREFLTLLEALKADVISPSIDDFYFLSKATLVKDESKFDRYDFAFAEYFKGVAELADLKTPTPEEWLNKILRGSRPALCNC